MTPDLSKANWKLESYLKIKTGKLMDGSERHSQEGSGWKHGSVSWEASGPPGVQDGGLQHVQW